MNRIIIFANGDLHDLERARAILRDDDFILCADGGARHALALGLSPNLIIGDMDSLNDAEWQKVKAGNMPIELFPRDKNETDLELALDKASELNPNEIVVVAALGGRIDHTLANIALLSDPKRTTHAMCFDDGVEELQFCRNRAEVYGRSGDLISLIPWGASVCGIRTENLKWELDHETLFPEKTRGVSNEMTADVAFVEIESGLLLIVHRRQSLPLSL
ncbi:MAG: thiamine diphosphokinase [Anaerolineaceae bacterium]|nr:thiamine diphosphokinase [Anaerolineaceae bacterium]